MKKRLKTIDTQDENCDDKDDDGEGGNDGTDEKKGEIFKHVKESKKDDIETLDAATIVCDSYSINKMFYIIYYFILGTT